MRGGNIIGLAGLRIGPDGKPAGSAGAGKDSVADILTREYAYQRVALADPMKRSVRDWFGWDWERLWGPSERRNAPDPKFNGLTPRKALQFLGTEIGRELYTDVWVEYVLRVAAEVLGDPGCTYTPEGGPQLRPVSDSRRTRGVSVSDVRYQNETDAILRAGGAVVLVVRPGPGLEGKAAAHPSERGLEALPRSYFSYVLDNSGPLEALPARIAEMMVALRHTEVV
jgi:hypothetical protein